MLRMALTLTALLMTGRAWASGPRFASPNIGGGPQAGVAMAFYTSHPLYYTDPGDLAAGVTHAQADAMVAAAAAVWNVPTASLVLAQGGSLDEHVSGANAYFDGTEMVFPADVQPSNYAAKQIAIIYDSDGSVTDALLGSGASLPAGCRQNGVTQSVDGFGGTTIQHAVIILNGRCVGSAPEQLTQMQYQLTRAFGRVVGLAWSQCNDNVFTGTPAPTHLQTPYWPLMHPIDIICGPYTYQCMQNPFVLRADDLSGLALLYPVTSSNISAGKTISLANGDAILAYVYFPTGQGMSMVNMTVHRLLGGTSSTESWQTASAVTGALYQQNIGNPIMGAESASANAGTNNAPIEGQFQFGLVPTGYDANLYFVGEPVNPLYTGVYALGPFERPAITPSGSPAKLTADSNGPGFLWASQTMVSDAAGTCSPNDGTVNAPAAADASGWWNGLLCSNGHTSWWSASIKAGRTWAVETTALDANSLATVQKAQPVIGVWASGDPTGTLPTVASVTAAMNSLAFGVTQLRVPAATANGSYRIAVADQFGAGRPDFSYGVRLLYADSVAPTAVPPAGGPITITGMGFRLGNRVLVNGVSAQVVSWTAQQIVANVPASSATGGQMGVPMDVEVLDSTTNGSSTISGALSYAAATNTMQEVSAPAAIETGASALVPFAVRVLGPNGVAPVVGDSVRLTTVGASASLSACGGASSCVLQTDATGTVSSAVAGLSAGSVTLIATEVTTGAQISVTVTVTTPTRALQTLTPDVYLAAGSGGSWSVALQAVQDVAAAAGVSVSWTVTGAMSVSTGSVVTGADGTAHLPVTAVAVGAGSSSTLTACVWISSCSTWSVHGVDSSLWQVAASTGAGQSIGSGQTLKPVVLQVTDGQGHPVQGASVAVAQTVDAWEGICAAGTRCAAAPVLASSKLVTSSDVSGNVTVTPLQVPGQPQVVNIAVSTGVSGFSVMSLIVAP